MKRIDAYIGKNYSPFSVAARIFDLKIIKLWAYQNADALLPVGAMRVQNHFSKQFRLLVPNRSLAESKNGIFGLSNR